ncbi:hypothetical protein HHI36_000050 [Cryptolaemus montrouzieri]|uniref:CRAL-TRIO domain-containing protein n=1 Tax=Cryptolaemus montrouzieri TaxID=559131 RepID=A0ABD2P450_9CUCU
MSLKAFSDCREGILKSLGKNQNDIDADLVILKDWIRKQPHLPPSLLEENKFLEILLMRNKFSIEKTKSRIENYCSLKIKYKYLFEDVQGVLNAQGPQFYYTIDKATENFERVVISKITDEQNYDIVKDLGQGLMVLDLLSRFEYSTGDIFIIDLTECSAQIATKLRLNALFDAVTFSIKAYSCHTKEFHVINKTASSFLNFIKPLIPARYHEQIYAHESLDSLKDSVSPKYLPKDYGGELKSLAEMRADWDIILKENHELMQASLKTVSREELRVGDVRMDSLPGTFRKLAVD